MEIKILGTGCPNCIKLENNTKKAVEIAGINANIVKISDIYEIMSYDIMSAPGFVIDGKVVSSGKILDIDEIVELLKGKGLDNNEINEKCDCSSKNNC